MLGENDGPSMISYATDRRDLRARVLPAVHRRDVRDGDRLPGDVHAGWRRHPPRIRPAGAAALRPALGLVRRRRSGVHQPRDADRRVRRDPRRPGLLPPRRRRRGRVLGVALVLFTISGGRYWRWERIVLGLAVFNGLFLRRRDHGQAAPGLRRARAGHRSHRCRAAASTRCCCWWPRRSARPSRPG